MHEVAHAQKRNPLSDLDEICSLVNVSDLIYCANSGDDRLRGLRRRGWTYFALTHWLWLSSLQHSHTTVRVCDGREKEWKTDRCTDRQQLRLMSHFGGGW